MTFASAQPVLAELDAMQLRLLEPYQQALRWDNIEKTPAWVGGVMPKYNKNWGMHTVVLNKDKTTFRLSPYQTIRLYHPQMTLTADLVKVSLDNGSGLAVTQQFQQSTDGHSLLLSPQSDEQLLVNITHDSASLELALFVSRHEPLGDIAPYRNILPIDAEKVWITEPALQNAEQFWHVKQQQPYSFKVTGPTRVSLRNRLAYETDATELSQQYRIEYKLNNVKVDMWQFMTAVETKKQMKIKGVSAVLGREEEAYIEIPDGQHTVEIKSDRNLFLQVLAQASQETARMNNDYLFPSLNEPRVPVQQIREQQLLATTALTQSTDKATKITQNNEYRAGGMVGSELVKNAALKRTDYPKGLHAARELTGKASFYRDLLPVNKSSNLPPFTAYFIDKALRDVSKPLKQKFIAEQHIDNSLTQVPNALFTSVSGVKGNSYKLPERFSPSQLRLVVDKRNCVDQTLMLQLDNQPAVSVDIHCVTQLTKSDFEDSLFEAAIKQLQNSRIAQNRCSQPISSQGQDCPMASSRVGNYSLIAHHFESGPLIQSALHELPLDVDTTDIRIWQHNPSKPAVNIALQYRTSKPFVLAENNYLTLLKSANKQQHFENFLLGLSAVNSKTMIFDDTLQNEWTDLKRMILADARLYKSSISRQPPSEVISGDSEYDWLKLARQAEVTGNWLQALERWGKYVYSQTGKTRQQGQLSQAAMLQKLGEDYLAESLLRYLSIFAEKSVATLAAQQLKLIYQKQGDNAALQRLASAMLVQWQTETQLAELIEVLNSEGQYRFVMLLGLSFTEHPPIQAMLNAAYQLQWWTSYQQLLAQLPPTERRFWLGLQSQQQGHYQLALEHWDNRQHRPWYNALTQGMQLRDSMQKLCGDNELSHYQQWAKWLQHLPGSQRWQYAPHYVVDFSSSDLLYSIERDIYSSSFRSEHKKPVSLKVIGPTTLNFQIRVLHPAETNDHIDGWLTLVDNDAKRIYPFSNNVPSPGLKLIGKDNYQAGNLINVEYQVGEGLHHIQLQSEQAPLSIKIQELRPELALTVLPTFHPFALKVITQQTDSPFIKPEYVSLVDSNSKLMLTTESPHCNAGNKNKTTVFNGEQLTVTDSHSLMADVEKLNLKSVLKSPKPTDQRQAEQRMMQYLWLMDQSPNDIKDLLFPAESLSQTYLNSPIIQSIWLRISHYSQWQNMASIASSAGLRFVDIKGWQPESPFVRARKALLPPFTDNEHVIFADQHLLFAINTFKPVSLTIEAKLEDVPYLPEVDAQLEWSLNENEAEYLTLKRHNDWQKITLQLPAGEHQLRFLQTAAISNQYLKLRFDDKTSDLAPNQQRAYFIGTPDEPVEFYIKGPAKLRIDQWQNVETTSSYEEVGAGWQQLSLAPVSGQQELLVRVKQRVAKLNAQKSNRRESHRQIVPVAAPMIPVQSTVVRDKVALHDEFRLGKQEDGTTSIGVDWIRRNNSQEDGSSDAAEAEQFAQYSINYRHINQHYWNTEWLARTREDGTPSFGINQSVYLQPNLLPFNVQFDAHAIMQNVQANPEWLAELRVRLSQSFELTPKAKIIPEIGAFARYLSLKNDDVLDSIDALKADDFEGYLQEIQAIDQDIYTPYKAEHPHGLKTAVTLRYQPYLDSVMTAKLSTTSNENMNLLNPDNIAAQAHWQLMFGAIDLDAGYRVTYYQTDKDRASNSRRRQLSLNINWQHWLASHDRLELALKYSYDMERNDHLGILAMTMHFGEGRDYLDFKPGEIDFRHLRERQIPDGYNNRMLAVANDSN